MTFATSAGQNSQQMEGVVEHTVAGPLLGWRVWLRGRKFWRQQQRWLLRSLSGYYDWPPLEPFRAECSYRKKSPHSLLDVPNVRCRCGIYAYKLAPSVEQRLAAIEQAIFTLPEFLVAVVGTVSLWGRTIEHADGFRAELAYPSALCIVYATERLGTKPRIAEVEDTAAALEDSYAVPVRTCAVRPKNPWRWPVPLEWEFEDVLGWSFREVSDESRQYASSAER